MNGSESHVFQKNILGSWGSSLDDAAYGKALAALGALESADAPEGIPPHDAQAILEALVQTFKNGDRTVTWRSARQPAAETEAAWHTTLFDDPKLLADAWDQLKAKYEYQPRRKPRLAISLGWQPRQDLLDLPSLAHYLGQPAVGCQALSLLPEGMQATDSRFDWHWPVVVGVLAGQPDSESLMDAFGNTFPEWVRSLGNLRRVGDLHETCDLLILPPGAAAWLANQPRVRLRASFVVCLDDPTPVDRIDVPGALALMKRTGASGMAQVGEIARIQPRDWYREIIRELSHDIPMHAAVWGVGVYRAGIPPQILGLPEQMDCMRILTIAERIDRKRELFLLKGSEYAECYYGGMPDTTFPNGPVWGSDSAAEYVRQSPFVSEVGYGMPAAEGFAAEENRLGQYKMPRYIQGGLWNGADLRLPTQVLMPSQPSLLSIAIGPIDLPRQDKAFPDEQIDYTAGPVEANILVELVGAAAATIVNGGRYLLIDARPSGAKLTELLRQQVAEPASYDTQEPLVSAACQRTTLPQFGWSTPAEFAVWPQAGATEVCGRVSVVHQNRVLQTARITAPVGTATESSARLEIQAEETFHAHSDDLGERQEFDAVFIVSSEQGGRLVYQSNCTTKIVPFINLQTQIDKIYATVLAVTDRQGETFDLLKDEPMRVVLFSLAVHGQLLHQILRKHLGAAIDDITRIQLISIGGAYFPMEYVYDGTPFDLDAKICPHAPAALKNGACGECEHQGSAKFVCPLHFWGFSKVIERYGKSLDRPAMDWSKAPIPTPTRTPFGTAAPVVFAASDHAFKYDQGTQWKTKLIEALQKVGAGTAPGVAADWDAWKELVGKTQPAPKLLVLLPHSDLVMHGVEVLEIGDKKQFMKLRIPSTKELVGAEDQPQLLLLLGCSTAQVTQEFAPYPEMFREAGADIIIAPLAPILGADAAPIAHAISTSLAALSNQHEEMRFGELLRRVRCHLLAEGYPGVLGLVSFGDADWIFGG